jgi:hypothetical protein
MLIFFLAKVLTFVGLGPVFDAWRFRLTALAFCEALMERALAIGTHFGYFLLLPFDLPHG